MEAGVSVVIITGQPGSGKSTLARALKVAGVVGHVVDGDVLRSWDNPGYDAVGRRINVGRAHAIARYLHEQGESVAVSLVQPYADQRLSLRDATGGLIVYTGYAREDAKADYEARDYEMPLAGYLTVEVAWDNARSVDEIRRALATG